VSPYAINGDPVREERVTTNDAYLEPARDRPNLRIVGDALVDRVMLDGGRAVGVRVKIDGEWTTIEGGEVVLSAGAVHSPAILLRSGIGPGLAVNLPVGQHLQDHPVVYAVLPLRDEAQPATPFDRHTNVCVRYSSGLAGAGRNDMMIVGMNRTPIAPVGLIGVWINQCYSEGTLRLASPDPVADPIIDEDMISDERDRSRIVDGVRRIVELASSGEVQAITTAAPIDRLGEGLPSGNASDEEVAAWATRVAGDAQHICGTARMGSGDDAVVDPSCRVRGVDALRVVDASVFPSVPRANTHLMVLAIAEVMGRERMPARG
jgi:choline dehydrogenase-like flavoprotein